MPAIAEFTFRHRDPEFRKRLKEWGSGFIVAGDNYGQGSSREHAALAPLHLGVKAVIAKSFARIHRRNLISQGKIDDGDEITLTHDFSDSEREILLAGGLLSYLRDQDANGNGDGAQNAKSGGGRAEQEDAGEHAESDDGSGGDGVIREAGQGVGGHHE